MIYLDNAATTEIYPEVFEKMKRWLTDGYGNAGATYNDMGREAKSEVDRARIEAAKLIGANPEDIIFTSGGTEANNLAFFGSRRWMASQSRFNVAVSEVEHDSVLRAADALKYSPYLTDGEYGTIITVFDPHRFKVKNSGIVDKKNLSEMIGGEDEYGLVSCMMVNNETGVITNPTFDLGNIAHNYGAKFHTDCVQAAGCVKIDVNELNADFLSVSSHKIHGPKGVGFLYVRNKDDLDPLIYGGHYQEFGLRGGTENVAGIVGFGEACRITRENLDRNMEMLSELGNAFLRALAMNGVEFKVNGNLFAGSRTCKTFSLDIGVSSETLVIGLGASERVYVSAGSACTSQESTPSHVLTAMGIDADDARHSIRVSFSPTNTVEEVKEAARKIADTIRIIRGMR